MPPAVVEGPIAHPRERLDLAATALEYLERHPHFCGRLTDVVIEQEGASLFLSGRLPTFYLKQLVQEAVRRVPGVQFVYNQIDVVSSHGVSSVRS